MSRFLAGLWQGDLLWRLAMALGALMLVAAVVAVVQAIYERRGKR